MSAGSKRRRRSRVNATGRSEGHARFVMLHHWQLNSPAWRSLSGNAVKVCLHVAMRHNGVNNGSISYATRDGAEIGLSNSETGRALEELVALGFLKVSRPSLFSQKRMARTFTLTAEPIGEAKASKEFMSLSADAVAAWREERLEAERNKRREREERRRAARKKKPAPAVDKSPKARARREPIEAVEIFDSPARGTHSPARGTQTPLAPAQAHPTVPPAGLSTPKPSAPQSRPRDTYSIPGHGDGPAAAAAAAAVAARSTEHPSDKSELLAAVGPLGAVDNPRAPAVVRLAEALASRPRQPLDGAALAAVRGRLADRLGGWDQLTLLDDATRELLEQAEAAGLLADVRLPQLEAVNGNLAL